jgi:23S rRNA pseudouridine1911/1915/1917 synthase
MPSDSGSAFEILCEDGPVLAVNKPAGLLTLGAVPGVPTLERQVKQFLKEKYSKPGNVYLGIPHRLDRPVSGVVVFARNSKAAARLAEQFRERQVKKLYWALVERPPDPPDGELVDWLLKSPDRACVEIVAAETSGAREARLRYRTLQFESSSLQVSISNSSSEGPPLASPYEGGEARNASVLRYIAGGAVDSLTTSHERGEMGRTLLEIEPLTGRTHQIRVQLAARGWPIVGDHQYGAMATFGSEPVADPRDEPIALHARSLTILHPVRYDNLTITAPLPAIWALQDFKALR